MNPFLDVFDQYAKNVFWKQPGEQFTYLQVKEEVDSLAKRVDLPKRSLIAVQEEKSLDVLIQVLALWKNECVPVLIPADTPMDMMEELSDQVPFGEECPEGDLVFFSSGSSGTPKGIVHSIETLFNSAKATNDFYKLTTDHTWGLSLPVHHTGGFMIMLRTLLKGASIFYSTNWREVLCIACDFYSLVPTQLQESLESENLRKAKVVLIGGAAMGEDTLRQANAKNIPAYLSYGMTETAAQITSTLVNPKVSNLAGKPLSGSEITLSSSEQIMIKSNALMVGQYTKGIFHSPDLENGWFLQNDLGEMTEEGLIIKGRSDKTFISGGENINPSIIEKALMDLEYVNHAVVVPLEDEKFGHVPLAMVEAQSENLETIIEELRHKLPHFMVPKAIVPYQWDYQKSLKIDSHSRDLLVKLHNLRSKVHFHFEQRGTLGKPVLLMLHGFMGSHKDWIEVTEFIKKDFFIIQIELPGHGKSKVSPYSTQQDFLEELKLFVQKINDYSPLGLGYSMGGRMLLQLETETPGLFSKLVLESVHPGIVNEEERTKRLESDRHLLDDIKTQDDFKRFLNHWYTLPLFEGIKDCPNFENLLENKANINITELKNALILLSTGHQKDCSSAFENSKNPIHYLSGQKDQKYTQFAESFKSLNNPNLKVHIFENCSHNIHFQSPESFSQALIHALK